MTTIANHSPPQRKRTLSPAAVVAVLLALIGSGPRLTSAQAAEPSDLWALAKDKQAIHRYSTLITASQVRDLLATDEGIESAIDWCKKTGVTKVYIETFRSNYLASKETLERAKERFFSAGFQVSGCP